MMHGSCMWASQTSCTISWPPTRMCTGRGRADSPGRGDQAEPRVAAIRVDTHVRPKGAKTLPILLTATGQVLPAPVHRLALTKPSVQLCDEGQSWSGPPEPGQEEPAPLAPPRPVPGGQQPHCPPSSNTTLQAVSG